MIAPPSRLALALALLLALITSGQSQELLPVRFSPDRYVEYLPGDLPIVLTAPHGGREKPAELPDRPSGTFAFDSNTQELARAIRAAFLQQTGHAPHVIICRVDRHKLDCNREIKEGAGANVRTQQVWNDYQDFADEAQAKVLSQFGRGFYLDLHGHGHSEPRLELGYLHNGKTLAKSDMELDAPPYREKGSLQMLKSSAPYSALLRGRESLGALFENEGFASTPSPINPVPSLPFFDGGYSVSRRCGNHFAGLQIETNSRGVRDTPENRKRFGSAMVRVLQAFIKDQLDLSF